MNKIYKLIWSKTKNCWVVASELAKGHGKNKSRIKNSLLAVFVMSALLAGGTADVQALTQQEKDEVKNEVAQYLLDKIAHGGEIPGAKAEYGPTSFPEAIANRIFYYDDVSNKIGEKLKHDGLALQYFSVRPNYIEPKRDYLNRYANPDWTNVDNDGAFGAHSMALGYRAFSEAKHGVAIGTTVTAVTVMLPSVTVLGRWGIKRSPSEIKQSLPTRALPSGFKPKLARTKKIRTRSYLTRQRNYPTLSAISQK